MEKYEYLVDHGTAKKGEVREFYPSTAKGLVNKKVIKPVKSKE